MTPDLAFPYRLRYAADILREVAAYQDIAATTGRDNVPYSAEELDDMAAECEAYQRHRQKEFTELVELIQSAGGSGAWMLAKAKTLADEIIHAGYRKESSDQ